MENNVTLNLDLFKTILSQEARKTVGKCMKRFELSDDKEQIKNQIKELLYEEFRDLESFFINGKLILDFQPKKSKE